jgi:O-antigen ligase
LLATILSWRATKNSLSILFFVAALCAAAALGLSQSRGPILSLVIALLLAACWLRPGLRVLLSQVVFLLVIVFLLFLVTPIEQMIIERGISFSLRDEIWLQVWQSMSGQPLSLLWGIGMSEETKLVTASGEYHHAHNAWLDIFYRTGAVGLLLALIHLVFLLKHGMSSANGAKANNAHTKILVIWLIYGCGCLLVDSRSLFWQIDAKWLLYWVPAALLAAYLSRSDMTATTDTNIKR